MPLEQGVDRIRPRLPVRIALVVVGLAAFVYGTASLVGLVTPPWWERPIPFGIVDLDKVESGEIRLTDDGVKSRPGREWISGGVIAAGLALTAFGARARRHRA